MKQLLVNKIKCPDGTVLVSRHRHDFKEHTQADGRTYMVDGGLSYQRIGHSDEEFENLACYTDDPHEKIREHFEWTKRLDADGDPLEKPEIVLLKDITDAHLEALITWTSEDYPKWVNQVFVDEKAWRENC